MSKALQRISLMLGAVICVLFFIIILPRLSHANAHNILSYSDTITNSRPLAWSDHTLQFTLNTSVAPSGYFDITPPSGFEITGSSTFSARDVEMYVNGSRRNSSSSLDTNVDQVSITPGSPGSIRYTLNPSVGIAAGARVQIRIGSNSSVAQEAGFEYSTSTGTTTLFADEPGIRNGSDLGSQLVHMEITGGAEPAYADFYIVIVNAVGTGKVDTTEKVPPIRFNGAPTGEVGGSTLYVEMSLNTDERAICKYSKTASTSYLAMTNRFTLTGLIDHSVTVPIATGTINTYYIRCMDDEGNYNIDDYVIQFTSLPPPSGSPNTTGDVEGNGTGSGNTGNGTGGGGGGSTGSSNGGSGSGGSSSGGGGTGGGSSGVIGNGTTGLSGGGFEPSYGTYPSGDAQVIVGGYAFPNSTEYILVDGKIVQTTHAGSNGSFSVTLDAIARGVYTFGVYAVDAGGTKSTTFSTSFTVTGGKTSSLSNITLMPTVKVSPDPVQPGASLTISGYTLPNAQVTIENRSDASSASLKTFTAVSDGSGKWSIAVDTSGFSGGKYKARAKALQNSTQLQTNFSDYTYYGVGQSTSLTADLNTDGKVNLTDFSILLYWWNTDGGNSNPPADINHDGKVNLTDFSIMLFNWTG